jgi:Tol biopolymer transport system component/DNA-binding winged helix-turn-helix (wHTH) protein
MEEITDRKFFFDEFEIDTRTRKLLKGGQIIHLKAKTFDLLLTLVKHHGEVLSKNDLFDLVWENQFVEENNLTVHIAALRKALGETKNNNRFIVTVPGQGYRFIGELNPAEEETLVFESQKIQRITIETPDNPKSAEPFLRFISQRPVTIGIVSVLILVVGFGVYALSNRRKSNLTGKTPQNFSIKRLTTDGLSNNTALSPDGKLFVFSHFEGELQSLWLGHVDGGEPIQIRPPSKVVFSALKFTPDGSSVYYSVFEENGKGAIYKIPVFGGVPEKIEDQAYTITFSPDGTRFAFVRHDSVSNKTGIMVCDAAGKNEITLAVSPDKMDFSSLSPAWSPDGSTIAVGLSKDETGTNWDVATIKIADGNLSPLTTQSWSRITAMAWLADGSGLIVAAEKIDSTRQQPWFVGYPDGEVQRLVTDLNIYGSTMTLAANQSSFLTLQGQTQSNIWVAPADDLSRAKQITFGSIGRMDGWFGVDWTSDGHLVYTRDIDGNNSIWTMNTDGSQEKQLIPLGGDNSMPSVTADNRFIVFESNRSGKHAVWRANSDGSDLRQLTNTEIAKQPIVSPDGQWIVYVSGTGNSGELWRIPISGGEPLKLADHTGWPRISPDSKLIACEFDADRPRVAIIPIEGGAPIKLFDISRLANLRYGPQWTADGKAVTYRDWADGIWRQDLDGGEPQRLKGLPNEKIYAFDWSPDGKWFAFTRGSAMTDVVLISNFR